MHPGDNAVDILKQHHIVLYQVLKNPMDVAATLYAERVIMKDVLDEMRPESGCLSINDQTTLLLKKVEMVIRGYHYNLKVFCSVLCKYQSTFDVGSAILTEYRELSILHSLVIYKWLCYHAGEKLPKTKGE